MNSNEKIYMRLGRFYVMLHEMLNFRILLVHGKIWLIYFYFQEILRAKKVRIPIELTPCRFDWYARIQIVKEKNNTLYLINFKFYVSEFPYIQLWIFVWKWIDTLTIINVFSRRNMKNVVTQNYFKYYLLNLCLLYSNISYVIRELRNFSFNDNRRIVCTNLHNFHMIWTEMKLFIYDNDLSDNLWWNICLRHNAKGYNNDIRVEMLH